MTDCEVNTMEVVGEFMCKNNAIWQYFTEHWKMLRNRFIRKILAHNIGMLLSKWLKIATSILGVRVENCVYK